MVEFYVNGERILGLSEDEVRKSTVWDIQEWMNTVYGKYPSEWIPS